MKFLLAATCLALSACGFTPQGDLVRETIRDKGAQAYDAGLENAAWFQCEAASIGSIERKYGTSAELAAAYNMTCGRRGYIITGKP